MKTKTSIVISCFSIGIVLVGVLSFFTIKNSKNCDQFVVDTNEIISGINIPKQAQKQCFYDRKQRTRVGVYTIKNTEGFITKYGFKELELNNHGRVLWSHNFLLNKNVDLPASANHIFCKQGVDKGDEWQCLVDAKTGTMWFEIKWKE